VTAVGDDVRRTHTIRTAFVQVRVGGAFSEALVRTPASANDVHGQRGRGAECGIIELVLVLESATFECPYSKMGEGAVEYRHL